MTATTTPLPMFPLPADSNCPPQGDGCPICAAHSGQPCRNVVNGQERPPHWSRSLAEVPAR